MKKNQHGQRGFRVLIVEDDAALLRLLCDILKDEGFEAFGCLTALEALNRLGRADVDVAIVDLRLPDLSEKGLLRKLGAFSEDIPVIIHTAYSSYDSAKGALEGGAFAYVEKTAGPEELVRQVHRAVQVRLVRRAEALETAVAERTLELQDANEALRQEIAERRQAEEALRASEERMRLALQNVPVLVDASDEKGRIIVWNRECERVTGYSQAEMVGNPRALELLYPDPAYRESVLASVRKEMGDFRELEFTLANKDGGARIISWSNLSAAHPIPGWSTWAVGVDVTQRKQTEQELHKSKRELEKALDELRQTQQQVIQQERLRALGEMASGVAHDLNNSLSPVLGYAELAALTLNLPDEVRGWLQCVQTGARDAAAVVERLRQFYRSEDDRLQTLVDLGRLLREIPELTRPKWRDEAQRTGRLIEVDMMLQDGVYVLGNPAELREVFTNLVFNAVNAMPAGGRITLGLHATTELAVAEVSDTGIGMTDEDARRCFEPFFTVRKGEGSGLGLSVCHGITTRHGGQIEIDTAPGCGATVRVCLPISRQSGSTPPEPIEDALPSRRVLYIDDDLRLRRLAGDLFERLGQKTDLAESGAEGLEMFRSNEYDVVVTDLGMPVIDGRQVTRMVKSIQPHVPVIMVTGRGSSPLEEGGAQGPPPDEILAKPLTATKLSRVLKRVFAQAAPPVA